jgi:toxin ParE1/3/4
MPRLTYDQKAEEDLDEIYDFIGVQNKSPAAADAFIDSIRRACEPYARQPLMGESRNEFGPDIRGFSHTRNYIVIYRVLDDGIDVLRVIHTARNWRRVFRHG